MRERAETMASDREKAAALAKAKQAEQAADMDRWVSSPELKPPTQ
jgi:hypothetical protein